MTFCNLLQYEDIKMLFKTLRNFLLGLDSNEISYSFICPYIFGLYVTTCQDYIKPQQGFINLISAWIGGFQDSLHNIQPIKKPGSVPQISTSYQFFLPCIHPFE